MSIPPFLIRHPTSSRWLFICWGWLALALAATPTVSGKEPAARIVDAALMNSDRELLLYFIVKDAITDEMRQGIENGIPLSFSFFTELYQDQPGLPETKIVSRTFDHTLTYDPLKQEYTVKREEGKDQVSAYKSFNEAQWAMTTIHDYKLADLNELQSEARFTVKIKAKLAGKALPLNLQALMPFSQLWKFETDWYTLPFSYGQH